MQKKKILKVTNLLSMIFYQDQGQFMSWTFQEE